MRELCGYKTVAELAAPLGGVSIVLLVYYIYILIDMLLLLLLFTTVVSLGACDHFGHVRETNNAK